MPLGKPGDTPHPELRPSTVLGELARWYQFGRVRRRCAVPATGTMSSFHFPGAQRICRESAYPLSWSLPSTRSSFREKRGRINFPWVNPRLCRGTPKVKRNGLIFFRTAWAPAGVMGAGGFDSGAAKVLARRVPEPASPLAAESAPPDRRCNRFFVRCRKAGNQASRKKVARPHCD